MFLLVLLHFRFMLALLLFLWRRFFYFFDDLLVSFFEIRLLNFNVFSCLIPPFMLYFFAFSVVVL